MSEGINFSDDLGRLVKLYMHHMLFELYLIITYNTYNEIVKLMMDNIE